jgi:hypothetical protein
VADALLVVDQLQVPRPRSDGRAGLRDLRGNGPDNVQVRRRRAVRRELPTKLHRAIRRFLVDHHHEALAAWDAAQRREPPGTLT